MSRSGPMATVGPNCPRSPRGFISKLVWCVLLLLFGTITLPLLYLTPRPKPTETTDGVLERERLDFPTVPTKPITFENVKDLHQDDPRLIDYVKTNVVIPPPLTHKYNGTAKFEGGGNNTEHVMALFNNKTNGFFIESGANDGVFLSNTLPLEVLLNWTGLLVEADSVPYKKLVKNRRNAWISHSCLSLEKHPTTVSMRRHKDWAGLSYLTAMESETGVDKELWPLFTSNCFPFYSFLLAIGRTEIDYLALDIEKSELWILSTIPWDKVFIKTVTIEVHPDFVTPMRNYMESIGYMYIKYIIAPYTHDQLYIHPKALHELNISAAIAYTKGSEIPSSKSFLFW